MKFSLRSLMLALTLFSVLLGGRIEYLRRMAVFHEREAERYATLVEETQHILRKHVDNLESEWVNNNVVAINRTENGINRRAMVTYDFRWMHYHRRLAFLYHEAVYRPWTLLDEKSEQPEYFYP